MKLSAERTLLLASAFASVGLLAGGASAQPQKEPPPAVKSRFVAPSTGASDRVEGWSPGLLLGGTFNLSDNRSVVGRVDGTGVTAGFMMEGSLEYNKEAHESRTTVSAVGGVTRTPALDAWVKTRDLFSLDSIYLYHIQPWFGPFGRLALDTQLFAGSDPQQEPTTYLIARADGTPTGFSGPGQNLANLFNLTGVTDRTKRSTELWATWIVGAPLFGRNTAPTAYVAIAADRDHDGIYDDAPDTVLDADRDGDKDEQDLNAYGVASNIETIDFFIQE